MIYYKKDQTAPDVLGLIQAERNIWLCFQHENWSLAVYQEEFEGRLEVAEQAGLSLGRSLAMGHIVAEQSGIDFDALRNGMEPKQKTKLADLLHEGETQWKAAVFFTSLNNDRHHELKRRVHNVNAGGDDKFPKSIPMVLRLAETWVPSRTGGARKNDKGGIAFLQQGNEAVKTKPTAKVLKKKAAAAAKAKTEKLKAENLKAK